MTAEIVVRRMQRTFAGTQGRADVVALADISFEVGVGEIYCLLGPSGCGKSTILNILAGFERASAGEVLVEGRTVERPSPQRAVVFQQPQLFPWLDVWDNVMFGPRVQGRPQPAAADRAEFLLRATGLLEFRHHRVYELSGGMRQRVAIARALINEPRVLLMDEPFGALDAQTRLAMQELLLAVWAELRPTIVFVTHDVDEALFLGDRVCIMSPRPGRVARELTVPIARPRTADVTTSPQFVALKRTIMNEIRREEGLR